MTRLMSAVLFVLLYALPVEAALTLAQSAQSADNPSALQNPTLAFGSNVAAGNLLVVAVVGKGFSTDTATISDTLTNTYTSTGTGPYVESSTVGTVTYLFYAVSGSGGANTITVNWASHAEVTGIAIYEFHDSGGGTWGLDGTATGVQEQASTANPSVGSITTTASASVVVTSAMIRFGTVTAGTGYTLKTVTLNTTSVFAVSQYKITSGAGAVTGDYTVAASGVWAGGMAAFKVTASAPDTEFLYRRRAS